MSSSARRRLRGDVADTACVSSRTGRYIFPLTRFDPARSHIGITPMAHDLPPPGRHQLTIAAPSGPPETREVVVRAGMMTVVDAPFRARDGSGPLGRVMPHA